MNNRLIALVALSLSFSLSADSTQSSAAKSPAQKSSLNSFVADYGIPVAAESGLEALKAVFEPVKDRLKEGICSSHWSLYGACWFIGNSIDLQRYNIQNGLSRHLQEKVSSYSNNWYNYILAPDKPQGAVIAEAGMAAWRGATTKAQSLESIKARITLGSLRPVLDSLFGLASESYLSQTKVDPAYNAARIVAYGTVLVAAYFPEYNGTEQEINANAKSLLALIKASDERAQDPLFFRNLVEHEVVKQLTPEASSDPALAGRLNSLLCAWTLESPKDWANCNSSEGSTQDPLDANAGKGKITLLGGIVVPDFIGNHLMTVGGLFVPALIFNTFPQVKDSTSILLFRTALNSVAQNGAEAATRVDLTDFFANLRRSVQRYGTEEEKSTLLQTDSYKLLRDREFLVTKSWSELGKRMRANMQRYLAITIPSFAEAAHLMASGRNQEAAATFSSLLSYVRQYDPEYRADDVFMKMASYAIFGDVNFLESQHYCENPRPADAFSATHNQDLLGHLYSQLALSDPGFEKASSVGDYYSTVLTGLSDPLKGRESKEARVEPSQPSLIDDAPLGSVALSLATDLLNALFKDTLGKVLKYAGLTAAPKAVATATDAARETAQKASNAFAQKTKEIVGKMISETYARSGEMMVRGVGEPAKEDIQQWLASVAARRTQVEDQLAAGAVEMNGRTGGDAQMARAIFERLQPVLFHIIDSAREAYQMGDKASASRLIAYSVIFIAYYYPEAPTNDLLISKLAKSRFSQFAKPGDAELASLIADELAHFVKNGSSALPDVAGIENTAEILAFDPILACQLTERMEAFELVVDPSLRRACPEKSSTESWAHWSKKNGKLAAFYVGLVAVGVVLPTGAVLATPALISTLGGSFVASCAVKGTVSLGVTSVFNGITGGLLNKVKSWAQRSTQWLRATPRVDEDENSDRAQNYFGGRQGEVPLYLSPNAQEGRKDLLTVSQNIAQNLKNAKIAQLHNEADFADSQINSLRFLLKEFFSEATAHYEPLLTDMTYAFFGKGSVESGPEKIVDPGNQKEGQKAFEEPVKQTEQTATDGNIEAREKPRDEL